MHYMGQFQTPLFPRVALHHECCGRRCKHLGGTCTAFWAWGCCRQAGCHQLLLSPWNRSCPTSPAEYAFSGGRRGGAGAGVCVCVRAAANIGWERPRGLQSVLCARPCWDTLPHCSHRPFRRCLLLRPTGLAAAPPYLRPSTPLGPRERNTGA